MEEVIPQGIPCWTASDSRLGEPPPSPPPPPPCGPPPLDLRLRAPPPPQPPGRPLPIGERSGGWGRSSSSGGAGSTAGGEAWSMVWVRLRGGLGGGITFREAWPGLLHPLGGARGRPRLKPRCRLLNLCNCSEIFRIHSYILSNQVLRVCAQIYMFSFWHLIFIDRNDLQLNRLT